MLDSNTAVAVALPISAKVAPPVVGKVVMAHTYIHKSHIHLLPEDLKIMVALALRAVGEFEYDLVKVAHDGSCVCLLRYPGFDTKAHPTLKYSIKVLLPSKQFCVTDYSKSANPPILRRKDTLVPDTYPHYAKFHKLTVAEEAHGLLSGGDMNRKQWEAILKSKNITLKGHSLTKN